MTAYMNRKSEDAITYNPLDLTQFRYVFVGEGMDYQLSYVFKNNIELIGRYSTQKLENQIKMPLMEMSIY